MFTMKYSISTVNQVDEYVPTSAVKDNEHDCSIDTSIVTDESGWDLILDASRCSESRMGV